MSSSITLKSGGRFGGSPLLQTGHGTPAPHSQASALSLNILNGWLAWVSQTQPVSSQFEQLFFCDAS